MSDEQRTAIRSYQDLLVWQDAMSLAETTYSLTKKLPKEEIYGLIAQMRRSAVSVPSNIAEGYARESKPSYAQFLRTARGSLRELETQFMIAQRAGMLEEPDAAIALEKCEVVAKKLHGLIRSLQSD